MSTFPLSSMLVSLLYDRAVLGLIFFDDELVHSPTLRGCELDPLGGVQIELVALV